MSDSDNDHFGPIDYFVVAFTDGAPAPAGFQALLDLVDAGTIRIIDVELVHRSGAAVARVDIATNGDPTIAEFAGASAGLLDDEDLAQLAEDLADGSSAAIVVYEELAILSVFDAFEAAGAHLVSEGHLSVVDLVDALDATEPA